VLEAKVVVNSIIKGLRLGAKLIVSYTPWWLWLTIILVGILRFTARIKSKER